MLPMHVNVSTATAECAREDGVIPSKVEGTILSTLQLNSIELDEK